MENNKPERDPLSEALSGVIDGTIDSPTARIPELLRKPERLTREEINNYLNESVRTNLRFRRKRTDISVRSEP